MKKKYTHTHTHIESQFCVNRIYSRRRYNRANSTETDRAAINISQIYHAYPIVELLAQI